MMKAQELAGELKDRGPRSKNVQDERLLNLYWNRAELKKEFRKLRDENYALAKKVESKEESRLLLVQRIEALEKLLANPEAGFNAIVYFQLRFIWRTCHAELAKFALQLNRQQLERMQRAQIMQFNRERAGRIEMLRGGIQEKRERILHLSTERSRLEREAAGLSGFWNHFRRRKRDVALGELQGTVSTVTEEMERLIAAKTALEQSTPTPVDATSVAARRMINLAVIALAQQLFEYFDQNGLARLSHEAMIKSIEEIKYGHRSDCIQLIDEIPRVVARMKSEAGFTDLLRERTSALKSVASYKSDGDTIPRPDSIDGVLQQKAASAGMPTVGDPVNVLASDFWDVCSALTP